VKKGRSSNNNNGKREGRVLVQNQPAEERKHGLSASGWCETLGGTPARGRTDPVTRRAEEEVVETKRETSPQSFRCGPFTHYDRRENASSQRYGLTRRPGRHGLRPEVRGGGVPHPRWEKVDGSADGTLGKMLPGCSEGKGRCRGSVLRGRGNQIQKGRARGGSKHTGRVEPRSGERGLSAWSNRGGRIERRGEGEAKKKNWTLTNPPAAKVQVGFTIGLGHMVEEGIGGREKPYDLSAKQS